MGRMLYRVILVKVKGASHMAVLSSELSRLLSEEPKKARKLVGKAPIEILVTENGGYAEEVGARLSAAGGETVIFSHDPGQAALCRHHQVELVREKCVVCGKWICALCQARANGRLMCPSCEEERKKKTLARRTRQLFMLFLLTAFLYWVHGYLQKEKIDFSPGANISVGIIEFAPPIAMESSVIEALNGLRGKESFLSIGTWLEGEYTRYSGVSGNIVRVEIMGPFPKEILFPPWPEEKGFFLFRLLSWQWKSLGYYRYLRAKAEEFGISMEALQIKVFVGFSLPGQAEPTMHSVGSRKKRTGVVFVPTNEKNLAYSVVAVLHEVCHILGATDKYDQRSLALWPEGYADPFAEPLFPQKKAEIMAVDIPLSLRNEKEITSLEEVVVGPKTASEMGWIPKAISEAYYAQRQNPPPPDFPPE